MNKKLDEKRNALAEVITSALYHVPRGPSYSYRIAQAIQDLILEAMKPPRPTCGPEAAWEKFKSILADDVEGMDGHLIDSGSLTYMCMDVYLVSSNPNEDFNAVSGTLKLTLGDNMNGQVSTTTRHMASRMLACLPHFDYVIIDPNTYELRLKKDKR